MIPRPFFLQNLTRSFRSHKIVALLGPRQSGKTTLARMFVKNQTATFFDLEDPTDLLKLDHPKLSLEKIKGWIVIDEIQRKPELFPILRVLVDRPSTQQRFLILGSASRDLIRQSSESLAGRIRYIELPPFSLFEVDHSNKLWIRGGFPPSYLSKSQDDSWNWRKSYVQTFLERDIPALGISIPSTTLRRFWMMVAHFHGNLFNASEIGRSLGITDKTIRRYLDLLSGTFMLRQLPPWFENISKRQVKSPKIYFQDSGLLHYLLGIHDLKDLQGHPKLGSSWEGFALETVLRLHPSSFENFYFWSTQSQAELDLLWVEGRHRIGFEFKYSEAPTLTKSMRIAMEDLKLSSLFVVIPGKHDFSLHPKVRVLGLEELLKLRDLMDR